MLQMPTSIQPPCSTTNQRDGLEACALLLSHPEGDDPSEIGPERQKLQVEHALEVVFENGCSGGGSLHEGALAPASAFKLWCSQKGVFTEPMRQGVTDRG